MKVSIEKLRSTLPFRQMIVYPLVGGFTTGLDLVSYWLLVNVFGVWYLLSAAIISPITLSLNYTLHRRFTFRSSGKKKVQITKYFGLVLTNYLVGLFLLYIVVDLVRIHYFVGRLVVFGIIMLWNFLALKLIVFADPRV